MVNTTTSAAYDAICQMANPIGSPDKLNTIAASLLRHMSWHLLWGSDLCDAPTLDAVLILEDALNKVQAS
jgi:hypothetical protein